MLHHIQYLLKFPTAAITNLPSDPQSVQNMFLKNFHPCRLYFLGSRFTCLCHTVMPIDRIIPPEISTVISHIKQQTYSSKGQICFCLHRQLQLT